MGRPPYTVEEYQELAEGRGLYFLDLVAPLSVREDCLWKCKQCGHIHSKSFRTVQATKNGCACQNGMALAAKDYYELAEKLGIGWLDVIPPKNTKEETRWASKKTGRVVVASYKSLVYGNKISLRLKGLLELNNVSEQNGTDPDRADKYELRRVTV